MKNLTQKTSRKPKKTKKTIFQDSWKRKNAKIKKTSRKPKKPKKTIFQDSWKRKNAKIKKTSRKPKKTKKQKKKQYSRTLVCRPHLQTSGILFFLFFFGFLEVFLIFAFFHFSKSPGILFFFVFFVFFWFSRGFFDFCIFPFPRVLEYCFFLFFWFSRGFLDFCIFPFPRVLEYCFFVFFWFSRVFIWFLHFFHLQDLCVFFVFCVFSSKGCFPRRLNYHLRGFLKVFAFYWLHPYHVCETCVL